MKKQDFYNLGAAALRKGLRVDGWSTSSWQGKAVRNGFADAQIAARRKALSTESRNEH